MPLCDPVNTHETKVGAPESSPRLSAIFGLEENFWSDGLNPPGYQFSRIGNSVYRAVRETSRGTIHPAYVTGQGAIQSVVINDSDAHDEGIDEVVRLLKTARNEICIQTYRLRPKEEAAQLLFSAISEKQKENPEFKFFIAYNAMPWESGRDLLELLKRTGAKAHIAIHPPNKGRQSLHSKIFLLDGNTLIIGGDNIDNQNEKDLSAVIKGPIVDSFLAEFDGAFTCAGRYVNTTRGDSKMELFASHSKNIPDQSFPHDLLPLVILSKEGIAWKGDRYKNDADQGLIAAMDAAEKEIKIVSPNVNDPVVQESILRALKRGVKVQLLVPRNYLFLKSFLDRAANTVLARWISRLPVKLKSEIELRWFSEDGVSHSRNHTKFLAVDNQWCYMGSQNFDLQSFGFSREVGLCIDSPEQTGNLIKAAFSQDWETSIPAKPAWYDFFLPLPTRGQFHRLMRVVFPPLSFLERVLEGIRAN